LENDFLTEIQNKYLGHGAAITANVIFGLNIPVTKALLTEWMSPLGYTTTRMIFGLIAFWMMSFFQKKEKVERRDLAVILLCGFLGLAATQAAFALGVRFTSPTTNSFIGALNPIVVLALSAIFLREKITRWKAMGVLLAVSGSALIILRNTGTSSASNTPFGIIISITAVTCYAAYFIIARNISKKYSPITMLKWMFLVSVIMILPFGFSELPKQRIFSAEIQTAAIFEIGFALLFASMLGLFLVPAALKRIKATNVSIYINLQPIVASTAAIAIGQDFFSWDKPAALALVIAGVLLVTQSKTEKQT
jgi:drug/metabolite transporter (DMT)-like permease